MKKFFFFAFIISTIFTKSSAQYNKPLADSLGADEYGMKAYVLVILKSGPNKTASKALNDSLFMGHMSNIGKLVNDHKLVVAGPIGKNDKSYRGIFILDVKTIEEAKTLLATDPAVNAGLLDADLFPWYGSAALPLYLKEHDHIQTKSPGGK